MLLVFYVFPVSRVLGISVTEPSRARQLRAARKPADPARRAVTARICGITTLITLVLAYVVAYVLTQRAPAQRLMMLGVLLPLWMSVLVRAFAWVTLLRGRGW